MAERALPGSSASPMSTAATLSKEDETIVAAFDTLLEAEMARGRLEVDGIVSRIVDGNTVGIATHLSMALGGAKIVVAHRDLEAARAILFSPGTFPDLEEAALAERPEAPLEEAVYDADDDATRALRAAVFGLVFLPPLGQLWSLALLGGVWRKRAQLTARGRKSAVAAVAIDAAVIAAVLGVVAAVLGVA